MFDPSFVPTADGDIIEARSSTIGAGNTSDRPAVPKHTSLFAIISFMIRRGCDYVPVALRYKSAAKFGSSARQTACGLRDC